MGRFSGKSSSTAKAKRDFVRINPYEIPEIALAVIANICQKSNNDDASFIIGSLREILGKRDSNRRDFYTFIDNERKNLFDIDFLHKVRTVLDQIVIELLAHENTNDTQVVVGGGFSAGKSSFLNKLIGVEGLLPTGIDPVSMVATFLYCSSKTKDIVVKGINLKDAVVQLDKDVLQSIQHESKSKVYLASVLNKLFVEVPSTLCDGFVFIDTPGYNNSDRRNETNNLSDEEVALEAIGNGNVLLWIVDAGSGTIPKKDMDIIEFFLKEEDRRVAVIFNKADKKGEKEIKLIVDQANSDLKKYGNAIIDVLGYSSQDGKIYYSANSFSMSQLLSELRRSGNGQSGLEKLKQNLISLFDDEIDFAENLVIPELEKERRNLLNKKNENYRDLQDEKEGSKDYKENLSEMMIVSYDSIMSKLDNLIDLSEDMRDEWEESLDEIEQTNKSNCFTKDNISALCYRYGDSVDNFSKKLKKAVKYSYYTTEVRQDFYDNVAAELDRLDGYIEKNYNEIDKRLEDKAKEIKKYREIVKDMRNFRDIVKTTLDTSIKKFWMSAHKVQDVRVDFSQSSDVFSAIRSRDYAKFIACFANGVKLSDYNSEGYTPLTYAVKFGLYEMVKFLVDKNADLSTNDKRGYNALHTSIQELNLPVIELLLGEDPTLLSTKSSFGETVDDLKAKISIQKLLSKKL